MNKAVLDEEKRDAEEGGTRKKEGGVGRRDEESEKMKKSLRDASLASLGLVSFYLLTAIVALKLNLTKILYICYISVCHIFISLHSSSREFWLDSVPSRRRVRAKAQPWQGTKKRRNTSTPKKKS